MKLFWSPTSPYTRKVRAVIIEKGLTDLIEMAGVDVWGDYGALHTANPLGKVPAIVLDDGQALYDSPVICAYLDAHPAGTGAPLYPAEAPERWHVMKAEALADGILDFAVGLVVEGRKPADERSPSMAVRWKAGIERALDTAMPAIEALPQRFTQGQLALACALGYLDFRFPETDWRTSRPELARWYEEQKGRPCLAQTVPYVWSETKRID